MELAKSNKKPNGRDSERPAGISALVDIGIPIKMAIFNKTVLSWKNEPETAFYAAGSTKPSRIGKLWYTPHGVVVEQGNPKEGFFYKIIPLSNVMDTIVL